MMKVGEIVSDWRFKAGVSVGFVLCLAVVMLALALTVLNY